MKLILQGMGQWSRKNILAILVACAISLVVVSPHIRAWLIIGPEHFEGVYPVFHDDEITYQARIKEVTEGNWAIGNPYILEHKDDPFIMPPIAEGVIAGAAWLTRTSVPFVMSVSDVVLSLVGFLLLYGILLVVTGGNTAISLLYTVLFFCLSLSSLGRPISPQFNAIFLFLGFLLIAKLYWSERISQNRMNLAAGLVAGVTCFISPYYFTALLTVYFTLFSLRSITEKSMEPLKKNAPWFLFTFLPLGLLYGFFHLRAGEDGFYGETMLRYDLMHTHIPGSFTNVLFGVLAFVTLALAYRFLTRTQFVYGASALISIPILNWQNIITGTSLQFSSHYLFTTILLVLLPMAMVHVSLMARRNPSQSGGNKVAVVLSMAILFVVLAHNQKEEFLNIATMPYTEEALQEEQQKMEVFQWFKKETPEDSVVYVLGGGYDFSLPIYTENRVYYNFYAALYPASDEETEERWLIQQLFDEGISTTTIRDRQREFWGNKYIDSYQSSENRKKILAKLTGNTYVPGEMVPMESITYMYSRWLEIQEPPIEQSLARYKIDYILLSPAYPYFESAKTKLTQMDGVLLIATIGGNSVYSFEPPFE